MYSYTDLTKNEITRYYINRIAWFFYTSSSFCTLHSLMHNWCAHMHKMLRFCQNPAWPTALAVYELTYTFPQDSEVETPAFVLHILDNKKMRLQVNKEALRRAIHKHSEKTMSSITQSAGKVKKSLMSRAKPKEPHGKYLLPLHFIVQVNTYDSDDQADQEFTLHWYVACILQNSYANLNHSGTSIVLISKQFIIL